MITYEEAKKKAMKAKSGLDSAVEYQKAWMFYNSKATGHNQEDNEIVILKDSGKWISMTEYVMSTKDNDKPKKIKF